mgnify:CR=1 FL=1
MFCCTTKCCDWFTNNFTVQFDETDQGFSIKIEPKDASKATALKDLFNSAKRFCQAFCSGCC